MTDKKTIGVVLFPDFNMRDIVGPYEIFGQTDEFVVATISENTQCLKTSDGLSVNADFSFDECPLLDVLFVPGGKGVNQVIDRTSYKAFLQKRSNTQNLSQRFHWAHCCWHLPEC